MAEREASDTRVCTGPSHPKPTRLAVNEENFYFHRRGPNAGQPLSRCVRCVNFDKLKDPTSNTGTVDVERVAPLVEELQARVGLLRASQESGVGESTLRGILRRDVERVQKRVVHKIVLGLHDLRQRQHREGTTGNLARLRGPAPVAMSPNGERTAVASAELRPLIEDWRQRFERERPRSQTRIGGWKTALSQEAGVSERQLNRLTGSPEARDALRFVAVEAAERILDAIGRPEALEDGTVHLVPSPGHRPRDPRLGEDAEWGEPSARSTE